MTGTVLIVDANPAVQAMANAALYQSVEKVECCSNVDDALAAAQVLCPRLVLVASDIPEFDPAEFAAQFLMGFEGEVPRLVLLVPSAQEKELRKRYGQYFDQLLAKPFKSEQLRRFVSEQLSIVENKLSPASGNSETKSVAIVISDLLLLEIISRTLAHRNCNVCKFSSPGELAPAALGNSFSAVFIEQATAADFSWYSPTSMGKLVVIANGDDKSLTLFPEEAVIISRPLDSAKLISCINQLGISDNQKSLQIAPPLASAEQALLAAKLSTSVYQLLLTQEALRLRNWSEVTTQISERVLAVCREFDGK